MIVFGHLKGNLLSPLCPPINYSVRKSGLAIGSSSYYFFPNKYYFKHKSSIGGLSNGSVKAYSLDGENFFYKQQAGYAV